MSPSATDAFLMVFRQQRSSVAQRKEIYQALDTPIIVIGGIQSLLSLFIQFVDKKKNTDAEYQRKISVICSYQPSKPGLVEAYSWLHPCMDVSACVLSKAVKQPVALTGCLHREKGLSIGCDRDQVKGKEATPASMKEGSFKHGRFGGI